MWNGMLTLPRLLSFSVVLRSVTNLSATTRVQVQKPHFYLNHRAPANTASSYHQIPDIHTGTLHVEAHLRYATVAAPKYPSRLLGCVSVTAVLYSKDLIYGRGLQRPSVVLRDVAKHRPRWWLFLPAIDPPGLVLSHAR